MNPIMIYLLLLLVPIIASINIIKVYNDYFKSNIKKDLSGFEIAKMILDKNKLDNYYIIENNKEFMGVTDLNRETIKLSKNIFHNESLSSVSASAMFASYAILDKEENKLIKIRKILSQVIDIVTNYSLIIFLVGIFLNNYSLLYLSIASISIGLLFYILTISVDIEASKRASEFLQKEKILTKKESEEAKIIINSFIYLNISKLIMSVIQFIRDLF